METKDIAIILGITAAVVTVSIFLGSVLYLPVPPPAATPP